MDFEKLLEKFSYPECPVGLGGCKNSRKTHPCCEYNITIFDNRLNEPEEFLEFEGEIAKINHGSLDEKNSGILIQYDEMKIVSDEKWELRMFLSKIKEKREKIFRDYAKESLIDSLFCVSKAQDGIKNSDPFSFSWIKCAAFFLSDALLVINKTRLSPSHTLEYIRDFEKNRINEKFSTVNEIIGIERATPSLLSRMCKSTMGFSDEVEANNHSKIIQRKYDYFVKNSLFSDCYYYLGYINKINFIKMKNHLNRKPELIHILRVAFDLENDMAKMEKHCSLIHKDVNELMSNLHQY